jgi:hypothetical protein
LCFEIDLKNGSGITRYLVNSSFQIPEVELDLYSIDLTENEFVLSETARILGLDERVIEAEVILQDHLNTVIRTAMERTLSFLKNEGAELWNSSWKGWERDDPPPLDLEIEPARYLSEMAIPNLEIVLSIFFDELYHDLINIDLDSFQKIIYSSVSSSFCDMVYEKFHDVIEIDKQYQKAYGSILESIYQEGSFKVNRIEVQENDPFNGKVMWKESGGALSIDDIEEDPLQLLDFILKGQVDRLSRSSILKCFNTTFHSGIEEVRNREWVGYDHSSGPGVIRTSMIGPVSRSNRSHVEIDLLEKLTSIKNWTLETMNRSINGICNDIENNREMNSNRFFLGDLGEVDGIIYGADRNGLHREKVTLNISVGRSYQNNVSIVSREGNYNPDPASERSRYISHFEVLIGSKIDVQIRSEDRIVSDIKMDLSHSSSITVHSMWPMDGIEYHVGETLIDLAMDKGKEAAKEVLEVMMNITSRLLPDTMSGLKSIPPVLIELIETGDLDAGQIMGIISNITLEVSSSLRNAAREIIKSLIEEGLDRVLSRFLEIMGEKVFEQRIQLGSLSLDLILEEDALSGNDGKILEVKIDVDNIGLFGSLMIQRVNGTKMKFNGSIFFSNVNHFFRIEIDPFMEDRPHMISIDGYKIDEDGDKIRISLGIPDLLEYRSTEISISRGLGLEPMIPIPPLGIQMVFDAGFRLKYRMPDELPPTINEMTFENGIVKDVEIFNPRSYSIGGSTLELVRGQFTLLSILLEGRLEEYYTHDVNFSMVDGDDQTRDIGTMKLVLRSSTGLVLDEVEIPEVIGDAYSREKDGYGVWRWTEGTIGEPNSISSEVSIRSILISLAINSLKEAWTISYDLFGLSFNTVIHFLELSVTLFKERFLEMVSRVVLEISLFISLEVEDASGTGGGGVELELKVDGGGISIFLEWLSRNIEIIMMNILDPENSGDIISLPWEVLDNCWISILYLGEIETPVQVDSLAPEGSNIPDTLTMGYKGELNFAFPAMIMGIHDGEWRIELGVIVVDAPIGIVGLFYDLEDIPGTKDLYLVHAIIWKEKKLYS